MAYGFHARSIPSSMLYKKSIDGNRFKKMNQKSTKPKGKKK